MKKLKQQILFHFNLSDQDKINLDSALVNIDPTDYDATIQFEHFKTSQNNMPNTAFSG